MEEIVIVTLVAVLFLVLPIQVSIIIGLLIVMRIGYLAYQKAEIDENSSLEPQFLGATVIAVALAIFVPALRVQLMLAYIALLSIFRFVGRAMAIRHRLSVEAKKERVAVSADVVEQLIDNKMNKYFNQIDLLKKQLDQSIDLVAKKANETVSAEEVDALVNEARAQSATAIKEAKAHMEADYERQKCELQQKFDAELKAEKKKIEAEMLNQACTTEEARHEAELKLQEVQKRLVVEREQHKKKLEIERDNSYKRLEEMKKAYESDCAKMEKTIKSLKNSISQMREEQDLYIQELENKHKTENEIIENAEIRRRFDTAVRVAKKELDIFSPWMNYHVVDDALRDKLEKLLKKGVVVKIRYGIGTDSGNNANDRKNKSEKIAEELRKRFLKYKNFHIYKDNSHAKLFICDDDFYVLSSFNILSYDGGMNSYDKRGELGECSKNKVLLEAYRNKYFFF